ncbi:DUF6046 domain-containing protein [Chryseobacterium shandongense]|uniref:DUF6046 domain-containing protein n=1 Tax=Chryseobacterium shandongense TaxID=1493872 RepID=A0ABN5RXL6_9FLAO|nr:DUF6046 domain-containing protein [Chryseobacterium shandongense]AZA95341.1 hypothetical protein EG353_07100 [Chryseobacterium shandongense]
MTKEELFSLAFGGSSPVFLTIPLGSKEEREISGYQPKLKPKEETETNKVYSDFGTEVVYPIWFKGGEYWGNTDTLARFDNRDMNYNNDPTVPLSDVINNVNRLDSVARKIRARVKMNEFRLPNATMVDFSRGKLITVTPTYNGSVKEIFGFDDWKIRIRMLCIAEKNRNMTGHQIANEVIKWSNLADVIPVVGKQFTDKDIYSLVIDGIDVRHIEGSPDTVAIELQCSSDEAFEIVQKNQEQVFHHDEKTAEFITMINNLNLK